MHVRSGIGALLATAWLIAACGSEPRSEVPPEPPPTDLGARELPGADGLLRFELAALNGDRIRLSQFEGDVVLIVNTATDCGFTGQLEGLQTLYESHRDSGFTVLGFPANDFAGQEPRSDEEIAEFCSANYGVDFPMFSKSVVIGEDANALFRELPEPDWNFNKYLLDRSGDLIGHWGAGTTPEELAPEIEALL